MDDDASTAAAAELCSEQRLKRTPATQSVGAGEVFVVCGGRPATAGRSLGVEWRKHGRGGRECSLLKSRERGDQRPINGQLTRSS